MRDLDKTLIWLMFDSANAAWGSLTVAMKVFLSHASEDKSAAEAIAFSLRSRGHKAFLDRDDLPPGTSYDQQIERAVRDSDVFIFLISPDSVAKGRYTLTELTFARRKWKDPNGHVLPVISRETPLAEVPPYLKAVTILEPLGNITAETSAAVDNMRRVSWRFAGSKSQYRKFLLAFCVIGPMVVFVLLLMPRRPIDIGEKSAPLGIEPVKAIQRTLCVPETGDMSTLPTRGALVDLKSALYFPRKSPAIASGRIEDEDQLAQIQRAVSTIPSCAKEQLSPFEVGLFTRYGPVDVRARIRRALERHGETPPQQLLHLTDPQSTYGASIRDAVTKLREVYKKNFGIPEGTSIDEAVWSQIIKDNMQ
jgi:hypothetical protein